MRRVLVVAYYFPPMGLSGVQRVAGFVRHLPASGWHPSVLTVKPRAYFAYDESLLTGLESVDIVRTGSADPTRVFKSKRTVSLPTESVRQHWAALNAWLAIPDNKLGWLPFAVRAGHRMLSAQRFDAVFSSAPPYTSHLVAKRLATRHDLPLVVDFRDDWVGNPRHDYPTPLHHRIHKHMEASALQCSSAAVTINESIADALAKRNPARHGPIRVIPHGFEPSIHNQLELSPPNERLRLVYTGVFYHAQTPDPFLRALKRALIREPALVEDLEVVFAGLLPARSLELIESLGLQEVVHFLGYLPHDKVVTLQHSADVLWMTIGHQAGADGISTGKLFDYMGTRKPILGLVPEGTARNMLEEYGASYLADPDNVTMISDSIIRIHAAWKTNALPVADRSFVDRFGRDRLAMQLAQVLDNCLSSA